jgi:ComF family protein
MRHIMASISQRLRLPAICSLCNQYHQGRLAICAECHQHLRPIGPACYHCAIPLPEGDFLICGYCCKNKPYVDQVIAPYHFEEPLRTLLHEFKYHEGLYLCSFLATLISNALPPEAPNTQCLIPVPMHPKRLRQRGFNQAAELTKQLGRTLNLPYVLSHCKKTTNTVPQASLNADQRRKNLQNAFISEPLSYQHITLVDDLLTTGSTVNELANVLKKQGVAQVDVWCCARTT